MAGSDNERRLSILRRTASEVRNYSVTMRLLSIVLLMLLLVTGVFYAVSALYKRSGSFTVGVDKVDMIKYGLTLSEHADLSYNTSHLNAKISEDITNIAGETIPKNVDSIDGDHSGRNYIAYTFYLQNAGEVAFPCEYTLTMSNITNGLDEAIRLRLYVDGTPTTYAKTKSDGSGPEPGTVEFYSANAMARGRFEDLRPGDSQRFTVVIWIEGNDPECLDWLIGGQLRVEMDLRVAH
ncbi:MAG: hypothetical protein IKC73_00080 [Clostridia bacterium]|nr:hypothetical protein [Clostridia bacterium]